MLSDMGMMINRRREMSSHLPYDAEVEYLEVAQRSVYQIDLAIPGKPNTTVEGYFKFVRTSYQQVILGSRANTGDSRFNPITFVTNGYFEISFGVWKSTYAYMPVNNMTLFKFILNSDIVQVYKNNGLLLSNSGAYSIGSTPPLSMSIFSANWYGEPLISNGAEIGTRCGAFNVYQDGVLVRDFIPVRIGTTGALYDKVDKNVHYNLLAGEFILGHDKVTAGGGKCLVINTLCGYSAERRAA